VRSVTVRDTGGGRHGGGRTVTSQPSIRTDLRNASANVVDEKVVIDGEFGH